MPNKDNAPSDDDDEREEIEPSELDELTHAEMSVLYRESTDTVRFAKKLQWWTVGSTLLVYLALIAVAKLVGADRAFTGQLTMVAIILAMVVIFTLVVYQFWQHTELAKIEEISRHMSSLFTKIRRFKSRREANVHRHLLLAFMICAVLLGAAFTHFSLQQLLGHRY